MPVLGTDPIAHEHVGIAVADADVPGVEQVPARRVRDGEWQLLRAPLYATEVASGDVIRVLDRESGTFEILTRGGNVGVQFYLHENDADDAEATAEVADAIAAGLGSIGGRVDAQTPGLIAFTVPVAAGFPAIEAVFAAAVDRCPGSQWQYTNVYDADTGELLDCWK